MLVLFQGLVYPCMSILWHDMGLPALILTLAKATAWGIMYPVQRRLGGVQSWYFYFPPGMVPYQFFQVK